MTLAEDARKWREGRRRNSAELSDGETRTLYERATELGRAVPIELLHRQRVLDLLGPKLRVEKTFRLAHAGHLPSAAGFDAGELTLLRRFPSGYSPGELIQIIATSVIVRAFRAEAAAALGLNEDIIGYLADAFEDHGELVGRALHLVERTTVETSLAIWRALVPNVVTHAHPWTVELALVHKLAPHNLRRVVLVRPELAEERMGVYRRPIAKASQRLTRGDGTTLNETDVWAQLFPEGEEVYRLEHGRFSIP